MLLRAEPNEGQLQSRLNVKQFDSSAGEPKAANAQFN
jgi:hypothetical protein